jgi:hypothetical protein
MSIRKFIKRALGDELLGALDYYRHPQKRNYCGGPFNGQVFRKKIFMELIQNIQFTAIVETGTYRGTTTDYLHCASRLPVYTVERNARCVGFAKARFLTNRNIKISYDDSRSFLQRVVAEPWCRGQHVFFYLDAHWGADLPLAEELEIIFKSVDSASVMVDDFSVPGDDGYGFDGYGDGKVLNLGYLEQVRVQLQLAVFFPSERAEMESGSRRGCVILVRDAHMVEKMANMQTIRRHFGST